MAEDTYTPDTYTPYEDAMRSIRPHIHTLEDRFQRFFFLIYAVVICLLMAYLLFSNTVYGYWDWLFFTSVLVFFFCMWFATDLPKSGDIALLRLIRSGALRVANTGNNAQDQQTAGDQETERKIFEKELQEFRERSVKWGRNGGMFGVIAIIMLVFLAVVSSPQLYEVLNNLGQSFTNPDKETLRTVGLLLALLCYGFFIGYYFGYAVSHGRLTQHLKAHGIELKVQPGHPDGVAGFKPIGDLYFFQAMLIAVPALYFAVWWFLIGQVPYLRAHYDNWSTPNLRLFAAVLIIEMLAFILPMWSVHEKMRDQKEEFIVERAASLSREIVDTRKKIVDRHERMWKAQMDKLDKEVGKAQTVDNPEDTKKASAPTLAELAELKEHLRVKTEQYRAMQHMPTWPIHATTFWKFVAANLGAFIPILLPLLAAISR